MRDDIELSSSECIEERGDMDNDIVLYYSQLVDWYGSPEDGKMNPLEVDTSTQMVIKYGKCIKCGFGDIGVAKTMYRYEYDIISVKKYIEECQ